MIGSIASSSPETYFLVGAQTVMQAPETGVLYLGCNDSIERFKDNPSDSSLQVKVVVVTKGLNFVPMILASGALVIVGVMLTQDLQGWNKTAEVKMEPIFISYSHQDKDYARKLADALEQKGIPVWIDDRIDYGSKWPRVIQENLDKCGAFILIMTTRSYESDWVQNELSRAQEKRKPIFPLLLEGDSWLSVQSIQYVDVRDGQLPPPHFYAKLAKVLPEQTEGRVEVRQKTRSSQFRKGALVQGRFKIEAKLARGEVLELYRAADLFLGGTVLLCVNFVDLAEAGWSDEQKSAITYAGMRQRDLPNVQEFFREGTRHFIVLEDRELERPEGVLELIEGKL